MDDTPKAYFEFDCSTENYVAFMEIFREKLGNHPDRAVVHGRPVLAKQQSGVPTRLMFIKLVGQMNKSVTLAIRGDNLYLIGYKGQNDMWYEFGSEGNIHMIPGSIFLGFDSGYVNLLYDKSLVDLRLGRNAAMDAISTLSKYNVTTQREIKRALAALMIMICESARLESICKTVSDGWEHGTAITQLQVQYMMNWGRMSRYLIGTMRRSELSLSNIGINVKADAAKVVHLVLYTPQPQFEVFGVRVRANSGVKTISLVDEEGDKFVVYKHEEGQHHHADPECIIELPLTETYRPVSADGKINIQVEKSIPTVQDSKNVPGDNLWGGSRSRHHMYNKTSIRKLKIDDLHTLELRFAVLRDAVEMDLMAQLNLKELKAVDTVAQVYGEITATYQHIHDERVLLFARTKEQPVENEINSTSHDSRPMSIPLMRPSILVPRDMRLVIKVRLFVVSSSYANPIFMEEDVPFDFYGEKTKMISAPCVDTKLMLISAAGRPGPEFASEKYIGGNHPTATAAPLNTIG